MTWEANAGQVSVVPVIDRLRVRIRLGGMDNTRFGEYCETPANRHQRAAMKGNELGDEHSGSASSTHCLVWQPSALHVVLALR